MVSSILITGESNLQEMSLGNPERKDKASKVKQYKRVLLNKYIDFKTYFLPYIKPLLSVISASGELVFSIDASVVGRGCMCLMFSVIYKGKAIPVIWKVYKAKNMASAKDLKSKFYSEIARKDGDFLSLFQIGYLFLLHLVDLRQWRAFSRQRDFFPENQFVYNCVPF